MLILYNFTQTQKYFTLALLVLLVTNVMCALAFVLLSLMPTRPILRHQGKCMTSMNLVKLNHSVTEC